MEQTIPRIINEARLLVQQGRASEALWCLENIATEALNQLGLYNSECCNNTAEALRYLEMAAQIRRCNWSIFNNLAHVANTGEDYQAAAVYGDKACGYCAGAAYDPYYNLGVIRGNLKDFKGAIEAYREGIRLNPAHPVQHHNLSTCLFADGQYEEGWAEYEYRLRTGGRTTDMVERFKDYPVWDGSPLKGKRLLVFSEQGMGDLIQFSRWLPQIKGHVTLECQRPAVALLKKGLKLKNVIARDDTGWANPQDMPKFDVVFPVCSLGRLFQATPENTPNKPYLFSSTAKKSKLIAPHAAKKKIGICWAGSHGHKLDYTRSVPLGMFRELGNLPDTQLFSLQKDTAYQRQWPNQSVNLLDGCGGMNVVDMEPEIADFQDVVNIMGQMDLVVTVDTSIAHVAGGFGVPSYLLLPYLGDWRWGQGEKTFWYPRLTLIRQQHANHWQDVFKEVVKRLA